MPTFSKLTDSELSSKFLPYFQRNPKFALFANAAKFQLEHRLPNHPCDFYHLKTENSKYYYVFRHDHNPDDCRSILMIGNEGEVQDVDVIFGLEQIGKLEPDLGNIELLISTKEISKTARNFFIQIFNRVEEYSVRCHNFYIPASKKEEIEKKLSMSNLPPGFSISSTRISDAELVRDTWKFAKPEWILQIKEVLQRLPTACIFHNDKPISFEMMGVHGQLNHQYTFPEYRNRGFGTMIEYSIADKCLSQGLQVVKSVELTNEEVLKRSMDHKIWKIVQDENGDNIVLEYSQYVFN